MKKVLICGAFDFKTFDTGGQPVKTRELYYGLCKKLGSDNVDYIETIGWKKRPIKLFLGFFRKAKNSESIIMLPAHNGVFVFSRLLLLSKRLFKNKIYYDVIGGWLPRIVFKNKSLKNVLSNFDGIWVETISMKKSLNQLGLKNIEVFRNFKNLKIVDLKDVKLNKEEGLNLCIFSRIIKEKGITDAIEAINEINGTKSQSIYLDIYGIIGDEYKKEFFDLLNNSLKAIRYLGKVDPSLSVETLKHYDALLFPTRFKTEGLPGTVIDAYAAGLPVISARWESFEDIIVEGKTGIGYIQFNREDLKEKLVWATNNKNQLYEMKKNCVSKAKEYMTDTVVEKIIEKLN